MFRRIRFLEDWHWCKKGTEQRVDASKAQQLVNLGTAEFSDLPPEPKPKPKKKPVPKKKGGKK